MPPGGHGTPRLRILGQDAPRRKQPLCAQQHPGLCRASPGRTYSPHDTSISLLYQSTCVAKADVVMRSFSPASWVLVVLGAGCWVLGVGCWVLGAGFLENGVPIGGVRPRLVLGDEPLMASVEVSVEVVMVPREGSYRGTWRGLSCSCAEGCAGRPRRTGRGSVWCPYHRS